MAPQDTDNQDQTDGEDARTPDIHVDAATGVGAMLMATRLRIGEDLRDVAKTLHIRFIYLQAIEDGRYYDLPGAAYALGFIRSYADYLGLDSAEVVRRFKNESTTKKGESSELIFPVPIPESSVPGGAIVFVGFILAVLAYGGWYLSTAKDGFLVELISPLPERLNALLPDDEKSEPAPDTTPDTTPDETPDETPDTSQDTVAKPEIIAPTPEPPAEQAPETRPETRPETVVVVEEPAAEVVVKPAEPVVEPVAEPVVEAVVEAVEKIAEPVQQVVETVPQATETAPQTPEPAPVPVTEPVAPVVDTTPATLTETVTPVKEPVPAPSAAVMADAPADQPPIETTPAVTEVATRPAPETQGRVYGVEDGQFRIEVKALKNSWIQVRDDAANTLILTRLLRVGDSYRVPDRQGLKLLTGNAGALKILVDGKAVPPIGDSGAVRRSVALDPDRLVQGQAVE